MKTSQIIRNILIASILFLSLPCLAQVNQVESIGITVSNMEKSISFFRDILSFQVVSDDSINHPKIRLVRMKLGDEFIELTQFLKEKGRPIPKQMKSNDLYFQHIAIVVSDMDKAYAILKGKMVDQISNVPQTIPKSNKAAAGVKAFYFHDLDHHDLELIYFPKGKGQAKWQDSSGNIFLGIDHTAIGISSTKKSLHFYQDILGINRKGDSWNKGMEQMNLSNVKGASLHITGLRANLGPGIEFLQYLVPGPGKPYPKDTKKTDIWYWQIVLKSDHLNDLYHRLKTEHYHFLDSQRSGDHKLEAFVVQDPDGHALYLKN